MSEPNNYDLIIIGAGPGGYVAAIRATQLGMKVAVVDKRATLGGVCLNEGCIPSKALLDSSELFALACDKFALHGIAIDPPRLDLDVMMLRKDDVVKKLTDGIAYLFKKNGIERIHGTASLKGKDASGQHQVEVKQIVPPLMPEGQQNLLEASISTRTVLAPRILLATGSEPVALPGIPFDGQIVVSSRDALCFEVIPDHLIVAGGGIHRPGAGLGLASVGGTGDCYGDVAQNLAWHGPPGGGHTLSISAQAGYPVQAGNAHNRCAQTRLQGNCPV